MHSTPLITTEKKGFLYKCVYKRCSYGLTADSNCVEEHKELNPDCTENGA
jgi:hypothetical protein